VNKSLVTNAIALALAVFAYIQSLDLLFTMSVFALSGAITNWLAIHMLFEKVLDFMARALSLLILKNSNRVFEI